MSKKHVLKITTKCVKTSEIIEETEEYFFSIYNAERRQRELEEKAEGKKHIYKMFLQLTKI